MGKSRFFDEIHNAVIEKEVDLVYSKGINLYFPTASITHPFACDSIWFRLEAFEFTYNILFNYTSL